MYTVLSTVVCCCDTAMHGGNPLLLTTPCDELPAATCTFAHLYNVLRGSNTLKDMQAVRRAVDLGLHQSIQFQLHDFAGQASS